MRTVNPQLMQTPFRIPHTQPQVLEGLNPAGPPVARMPPTALSRASPAVSLAAAGTCITFSLRGRRGRFGRGCVCSGGVNSEDQANSCRADCVNLFLQNCQQLETRCLSNTCQRRRPAVPALCRHTLPRGQPGPAGRGAGRRAVQNTRAPSPHCHDAPQHAVTPDPGCLCPARRLLLSPGVSGSQEVSWREAGAACAGGGRGPPLAPCGGSKLA